VRNSARPRIGRVIDLRDMVEEHLQREYQMICLTDQPERCMDVGFVDISAMGLGSSWGRMALFEPLWREGSKVICFDLATIIVGDITPLADVPGEFAQYRSVMVIGQMMGDFIWKAFEQRRDELVQEFGSDQECIRALYHDAPSLQRFVPKKFFQDTVLTPEK
jgi:hypothetical protein